jgi:thymidylate kinase
MNELKGLIVIDGSDGTGKTTLAKYFVEKYGAAWLHQSYRFSKKMFTYHTAVLLNAINLAKTKLVIIDRLWMSEDVYGGVYRNGTAWPLEGRFIDQVLLKHCAVQIIATMDPAVYTERFYKLVSMGRAEQYTTKPRDVAQKYYDLYHGKFMQECRTYADLMTRLGGLKSRRDCIEYDMTRDGSDLDLFCRKVVSILVSLSEGQYQPCLNAEYTCLTGHATMAKYILVGDVPNSKSRRISWPFYDYGNSSLYLESALQSLKIPGQEIMLTNACTKQGIIHIADIIEKYGTKKVIALGQNAGDRLHEAGIPHVEAPHPQYFRRFKQGLGLEGYAKTLQIK